MISSSNLFEPQDLLKIKKLYTYKMKRRLHWL